MTVSSCTTTSGAQGTSEDVCRVLDAHPNVSPLLDRRCVQACPGTYVSQHMLKSGPYRGQACCPGAG